MIGECGRRGGHFECHNIDEDIKQQLYKLASISLCPSVQGQVMVDLIVNPPKKGDESFESYTKEVSDIYESLKRRSQKLVAGFNKMEGVTCNKAQGAMYAFPQIRLPKKAVEAAKVAGKQPDAFYCLAMLDATGVVIFYFF
jgi:aspartate/methionine/tyrosine aminotransferase